MAQNKITNQLFNEIFRPRNIQECILLERVRNEITHGRTDFTKEELESTGGAEIINSVMLTGVQGTGKSSLTRILAKGHEVLELNASLERGVDVIRDQIISFASSASLFDDSGQKKFKIVILEEADGFLGWPQLRAVMEKYHKNVRFIANCNYIDKIPEPILSRFNVINFNPITHEEEEYLLNAYIQRAGQILDYIKIKYTPEQLKTFIMASFPDFRSVIKKIQQLYNRNATELTPDMLSQTFDCSQLFQLITTKPDAWNNYKALVSDWSTKADEAILEIGKNFADYLHTVNPTLDYKIPTIIIEIANHQNMLATAIDKFIVLESLIFKLQYIIWQQL